MNTNFNSTSNLDKVLRFITEGEHTAHMFNHIKEQSGIESTKELTEILHKPIQDGYIKSSITTEFYNTPIEFYQSTFDGKLFSESGGYTNYNKRLSISSQNEYIRTLILTYGTGAAGVYGLVEILKWLTPVFQFYCNCQFVWQK